MFGVRYGLIWRCFLVAAILSVSLSMQGMAQTRFAPVPQVDNVAFMQQEMFTDFMTDFNQAPANRPTEQTIAAPIAPAAESAPMPCGLCQLFPALCRLLCFHKSAPEDMPKPDTALGIRG